MDEAREQAKITRERNKAARAAQRAERAAQEKQDRALVLEALRAILKDPAATSAQRVYAVAVLENMMYYHFVPHGVKCPGTDSDAVIADFAKRLEEYQKVDNK